jgi:predicted SPOUT superfamily RNA methylase MTH1
LNLSIAIPDSSLSDETKKVDKTRKISEIARACAIFRVNTIYIYQDGNNKEDRNLMLLILKYLETPQFLRKRLFPKMNDLKFAGVLHPLKIPSHITPADAKKIKKGDVREGITVSYKGKRFVDVGINTLVPFFSHDKLGKRVTVQYKSGYPNFEVKSITKEEAPVYWGYTLKERSNLFSLIKEWKGLTISGKPVLVVFGSPEQGVHQIIGGKMSNLQNSKTLNFFPNQATETVRLEEALLLVTKENGLSMLGLIL